MCTKKSLLSVMILLTAAMAMGQTPKNPKFYVKAYAGYGLITPGSFRLASFTSGNFAVGSTGLGAGLHFGGGVGFIANDFLNLGLDADYLKGTDLNTNTANVTGISTRNTHNNISYSVLSLVPNVTFKALSKPGYFIYTRIGIILGIGIKSVDKIHDTTYGTFGNVTVDQTTDYKYNLNAGVQAALGVQFRITDMIRGFGEVIGNWLPISPATSVQVTNQRNYDAGNNPTGSSSTTVDATYTKSGSTTSGQLPASTFNVNYIGINLGVVVRL